MGKKELILPDDWEVKEVVDNKIIIMEKEKELPKTWEVCLVKLNLTENIDSRFAYVPVGMGNPILALCQLLICRNAWWKELGWKPYWNKCGEPFNWCIHSEGSFVSVSTHSKFNRILAFPTRDIANMFLESFLDLIEEAKELL